MYRLLGAEKTKGMACEIQLSEEISRIPLAANTDKRTKHVTTNPRQNKRVYIYTTKGRCHALRADRPVPRTMEQLHSPASIRSLGSLEVPVFGARFSMLTT